MFPLSIQQAFIQHALAEFPKECCGLVIDGGTYLPMKNVHDNPKMNFKMNLAAFNMYYLAGRVQAVLHSHTGADLAAPSRADMAAQEEMALPWGIVHISNHKDISGPFYFGDQVPIAPLVGRNFRSNVHDCYTLARDVYRQELNITLPVFPREPEWWNLGQDILAQTFSKMGFVQVDRQQIQKNDAILCKVNALKSNPVVNHIIIVRDNGQILHHLNKRVSRQEPLQMWLSTASTFLRYKPKEKI